MPINSPLEIAAQIDAALRDAGLSHVNVERDAIILYCHRLVELMQLSRLSNKVDPQSLLQEFSLWLQSANQTKTNVRFSLNANLDECIVLAQAHGTLTDIKKKELVNFHQRTLDILERPFKSSQQAL